MHITILCLVSFCGSCICASTYPESQIRLLENTCAVKSDSNGGDDSAAILSAFKRCGQGGKIVLNDQTYHVNKVMNTTGLKNVRIELRGKLLWSKDTQYWLDHSMPIYYQNQSTVWYLGGDNITFEGFGTGTLDGNGQAWYDLVKGISNYPRRPMGLTIWNTRNSVFQGLRFVQSQMWTMTIMHSTSVLLQDIYINSTSNSKQPARNTDGADTLYVHDITFRRWKVGNGDDGISLKANSTGILIEDCEFHGGAVALGSIGQYMGVFETIEDVVVRNIRYMGGYIPTYIKTWTGVQKGLPPNGGGGGIGFIRNITMSNVTLSRALSVFGISQCTHFSSGGVAGDCDTSKFQISDIHISNIRGTISRDRIADLKCSPRVPCPGFTFDNINVVNSKTGKKVSAVGICENVLKAVGISCRSA